MGKMEGFRKIGEDRECMISLDSSLGDTVLKPEYDVDQGQL